MLRSLYAWPNGNRYFEVLHVLACFMSRRIVHLPRSLSFFQGASESLALGVSRTNVGRGIWFYRRYLSIQHAPVALDGVSIHEPKILCNHSSDGK